MGVRCRDFGRGHAQSLIPIHDPFESSILDIDQQSVHGDLWSDQRTLPHEAHAAKDILPLTGKQAEEFVQILRQADAIDSQGLETIGQFQG